MNNPLKRRNRILATPEAASLDPVLSSEWIAEGAEIFAVGRNDIVAYTGESWSCTQAEAEARAAFIVEAVNQRQALLKALQDSNLRVEVMLDTMTLEQQLKASMEIERRKKVAS